MRIQPLPPGAPPFRSVSSTAPRAVALPSRAQPDDVDDEDEEDDEDWDDEDSEQDEDDSEVWGDPQPDQQWDVVGRSR
jgi:hypothetical protein